MEQKDMMNVFDRLYNKMAASKDPRNMQVFGKTMRCMMKDISERNPEMAMEYLDKLEAVNWRNYLSRTEAANIVAGMEPNGCWSMDSWEEIARSREICMEEMPYYNKWALYTAMNMVFSDSAHSIAKIAGKDLKDIPDERMFDYLYMIALDKLKDTDRMFDIRAYFHV